MISGKLVPEVQVIQFVESSKLNFLEFKPLSDKRISEWHYCEKNNCKISYKIKTAISYK